MINLEQEYKVSYVTSIERSGIKRGRAQGLEEGLKQGLTRGLHKGKREGRQEGEATLLQRLLVRKFGALPKALQQRLQSATPAQLETWSLNMLDADSLDDVFTR